MSGDGHGLGGTVRILIADSDQAHRTMMKNVLSSQPGFDVVAVVADGERAARLAAQLQPDIVILEVGMMRMDGSLAAESIALTTPSCQLIVLAGSGDPAVLRQAMNAGAREFLIKPVDDEQLVHGVQRVYQLQVKRQSAADNPNRQSEAHTCQTFAVWGPKGGVGRTFLAVNLAVGLATTARKRVLLMDGCLGFCTADVALDIESNKTILDLVLEHEDDLDPDLINRVVVHHSSGIDALLAPPVESMLSIAPPQLQRILNVLRHLYQCIIIDTRPLLDETTVALLDLSDVILTVCNPEIASLRNLRIFLDAAQHLGYSTDKIRLVVNRYDMKGAIPQNEIERVCRRRVTYAIPNDHEAVSSSINHGKPLVIASPQRPIAREISRLASMLVSGADDEAIADKKNKAVLTRLFARSPEKSKATP